MQFLKNILFCCVLLKGFTMSRKKCYYYSCKIIQNNTSNNTNKRTESLFCNEHQRKAKQLTIINKNMSY